MVLPRGTLASQAQEEMDYRALKGSPRVAVAKFLSSFLLFFYNHFLLAVDAISFSCLLLSNIRFVSLHLAVVLAFVHLLILVPTYNS